MSAVSNTQSNGVVGLVLVSHSKALAEGLADLVAQVSGPVAVVPVGGAVDGSLGTDGGRVLEALRNAAAGPAPWCSSTSAARCSRFGPRWAS